MTVPRRSNETILPMEKTCSATICGRAHIKAKRKLRPQGIILVFAIVFFCYRSYRSSAPSLFKPTIVDERISLSRFRSLHYAFNSADLVLLYFGASNLRENRLMRDVFARDARLLQPGRSLQGVIPEHHPLAIVYIPSDNNEGSSEWLGVTAEDRVLLKKKFRTCTSEECVQLNIEQRFPVPSLFVIDAETNGVLTPLGLDDLKKQGGNAVNRWQTYQKSVKGLEPSEWAAFELFRDDDDNS